MQEMSPYLLMQRLETHINGVLSAIDVYALDAKERKVIAGLKHEMVDARLDIRDYELSETRDEQLGKARSAKMRISKLDKSILAASEFNVFNAVDVAHLTAVLEQVNEHIR